MSILIKKPKLGRPKNIKGEIFGDFFWEEDGTGYKVIYPESTATLKSVDHKWEAAFKNKDYEYTLTKDTLEDAFRAIDDILYSVNRNLWVKTKCTLITKQFPDIFDK